VGVVRANTVSARNRTDRRDRVNRVNRFARFVRTARAYVRNPPVPPELAIALTDTLAVLCLPALALAAALLVARRRATAETAVRTVELETRLTRLEDDRAALEQTAVTDPLTGIWNYRYLHIALDRELARSVRARSPLAVLLLDLDGFASVNDEFGHQRGNAVLRDLAQRLALEIRQADTLGRYGGEEFLVLLPETDADGAAHVAERLCWTVRRHALDTAPDGSPVRRGGLTASIGIAVLPDHGSHAAVLLRAADSALAETKRAGGDGWRDALPPEAKESKEPLDGESELKDDQVDEIAPQILRPAI
jgi:diguanylate cyclase (GGDEF)-like protein